MPTMMKQPPMAIMAVMALALGTALPVAAAAPAAAANEDGSDSNSNRTAAVERLALQVAATPAVRQAVADGVARFRASSVAGKPDALRYVQSAVDETALLASFYAAAGVAPEPSFLWVYAAPRRWHGHVFPGTRWYADNADALYRAVRVDERSQYEITIRPDKVMPSQLTLMLYDWLMYENGMNERLDVPLDTFEITEKTPRNPDGSITLTLGPDPANGRPNHFQLKRGVRQVFVREIRGDGRPPAVRLAVKRTSGPVPASKPLAALAEEAVRYIKAGVDGTINVSMVFGQLDENRPGPLRVRWIQETGSADQKLVADEPVGPDRALGFVSSLLFNIKDDEAVIITLDMLGSRYLSVNSYRPFLVSPAHVYRTSSLNNFQARPNADGSYSFVFARKDPGVHNWIDAGGIPYGEVAIRWQSLTRPVLGTLATAVKAAKTVKLADLRRELPAASMWVTPAERAAQRETRARQFMQRCLGTPCEVGGKLDVPY